MSYVIVGAYTLAMFATVLGVMVILDIFWGEG